MKDTLIVELSPGEFERLMSMDVGRVIVYSGDKCFEYYVTDPGSEENTVRQ